MLLIQFICLLIGGECFTFLGSKSTKFARNKNLHFGLARDQVMRVETTANRVRKIFFVQKLKKKISSFYQSETRNITVKPRDSTMET